MGNRAHSSIIVRGIYIRSVNNYVVQLGASDEFLTKALSAIYIPKM